MPPATRVHLLILLLLPAFGLPRGVAMDWCLCPAPVDDCCTDCCGEDDEGQLALDDLEEHGSTCCRSLEVEDFDEFLSARAPQVPAPAVHEASPEMGEQQGAQPRCMVPGQRAPPPLVIPAGLRPGVRPLRV